MTILPIRLWAVALFAAFAVLLATPAGAAARFYAEADGGKIILFDDKCQLTEVANLPFRATWTEGANVYEGCWSPPHPKVGVIVAYFSDRTAVGIPAQIFQRLTNS